MIKLRIENDKGITNLLRKHPKYYLEYDLNVHSQGYNFLSCFAETIFALTIAQKALEITTKGLKEAKLI